MEEEEAEEREEELEDTEDTRRLLPDCSEKGVEYTDSTSTLASTSPSLSSRTPGLGRGVGRFVLVETDIVLRGLASGTEPPVARVLDRALMSPAYFGFL